LRGGGYREGVAIWGGKERFGVSWPAEVARAFEAEIAGAFEPYGFAPVVTPMKIGMLREVGEGAQLFLEPRTREARKRGYFDALFELRTRRRGEWSDDLTPEEFRNQMRSVADEWLADFGEAGK
jgi:hypothetical protein